MGSVALNSPRLGAFQNNVFPRGLDLGRCVIIQDLGIYRAADAAAFEQGMLVSQDAAGDLIKCVSKPVLGVAKWNKAAVYTAAVIDEAIAFPTAASTVNLRHPTIKNVRVQSAANYGGSPYTVTTDYTVNTTNGTITQVALGGIPLATTVYVSYTYDLTSRDLDFHGRNFFNYTDDVSISDSRVTVITDASFLFTSQYDTNRSTYALTGTGKNLYCGGNTTALAGMFTNDSGEGAFVGHVIQLPTADDPFLGVRLGGDPVIVT
jgi:hypothetical protein